MDWLREHLWETWLGLSILLGVAELFSLDLILLMLAVGAFAGMLAALLALPFWAQVLAAVAVSAGMLTVVRPSVARRLHGGPELRLGHEALIGREGVVTTEISAGTTGLIRLAGEDWTAESYDPTLIIGPGSTVEVFEIRGATAVVYPIGQQLGGPTGDT